jgi:hypothetical protein
MTSYPTHTWAYVVEFFRQLAEQNTAFAPMRGDVEQLAVSPFAAALYPVQSMHTLCLYQHDRAGPEDEQLRFEFEGGEFMVRYRAGSTPDPRFRLRPTAGVWTKRGSDPMALLDRACHHPRWFVEDRAPEPKRPHRDPAV